MKKTFVQGIVSVVALLVACPSARGSEVASDLAAKAAVGWLRQSPNPMNSGIAATRALNVDTVADDDGRPLFHAVRLEGGGTVVTSADTGIEPIVAFGPENMDVSPDSPLYALLTGDMCARRAVLERASAAKPGRATARALASASADDGETPEGKWARLLDEGEAASSPAANGGRLARAAAGDGQSASGSDNSPATVVVPPLTGTKWNQGGRPIPEDDRYFDLSGNHRSPFSLYTPSFCLAGCAPVAFAQILAYYNTFDLSEENRTKLWPITVNGRQEVYSLEWPKTQHRQFLPFRCVKAFPEQERAIDYYGPTVSALPHVEDQHNVGALLASCGALLGASYSSNDGTAAKVADFAGVLKNLFHYNGTKYVENPKVATVVSTIKSETEKKRIVCLSIIGPAGGATGNKKPTHAVIADGYGTSGSITYVHINMGWGGLDDIWYNLPTIEPPQAGYVFDTIRGMLYDMRPGLDMSELGVSIPGITEIDDIDNICDGFPTYGFNSAGILLEWRPFEKGKSYRIKRGLRDGTYEDRTGIVIKTGVTGTEFVDETAQRGVRYLYTIEMENATSMFDETPAIHLTGFAHVLPPKNVTAAPTAYPDTDGIKVSCDRVEGADSYLVYRWGPALNAESLERMITKSRPREVGVAGSIDASRVSDIDYHAKDTGDYYAYTIRSSNTYSGLSEMGEIRRVQSHRIPDTVLPAPTLSGRGDPETGAVSLQWNFVGNAEYYMLYSNDTKSYVSNKKNTHELTQEPGTTVFYRIQAISGKVDGQTETVNSGLSNPIAVTVLPKKPSVVCSTTTDPRSDFAHRRGIKISVSNAYYNFRYRVWRLREPNGIPYLVGTFENNDGFAYGTSFSRSVNDWHVDPNATYYYYVDIEGIDRRSEMGSHCINGGGSSWPEDLKISTVFLDEQGGTDGTKMVSVANGYPMPQIEIPYKLGFDFIGYFADSDGVGDQYYTASGTSARNWPYDHGGTLYAAWRKVTAPLSSISISGPATVASGESATYACTAKYSDGSTATVFPTWSVSSGAAYGSMGPDGVFTANETTTKRSATIKAEFGGKSATKTITITAAPAPVVLSSIAISGPATVESSGTATYTCTATYSDKTTETVAATWSLSAGAAYGSIGPATGVFTALSAAAKRTVTVKAEHGGKSATKSVAISARTLSSLAISGPDEIPSLETGTYACKATYSDGVTEAVSPTWSIAAGGTYATVVKTTGVVTSKNESETDQSATLRAASGGRTADKAITLLAKEPPRPEGDLHVDAEKGDDANDGRTWRRAKKTIQGAIDVAVDGDLILVFDGTYGPVDSKGMAIRIQSVNGADVTIVDGGGVSRCATLLDTGAALLSLDASTTLVGFTLRNGRSAEDGGGTIGGRLVECVLCDNATDGMGGGAVCAELVRCSVLGNRAGGSGGGTVYCRLGDCLVAGNESGMNGGGVFGGPGFSAVGCTIVGNVAETYGGGAVSCHVTNSIVWGNSAPSSPDLYGCDEWRICSSAVDDGCGSIADDPLFADPENGDYRLRPESPCIDAGDNAAVGSEVDLDGNNRVKNGAVDMGAYECREPWRVTFDVRGNGLYDDDDIEDAPADGGYYVLPAATPTREGYVFKGWTLADGTPVESLSGLPDGTRAVVLYADWAAVYYIVFKAADDAFVDTHPEEAFSGEMDALVCVSGEPVTLPSCAFARKDYACIGWSERGEDALYMNGETVPSFTRVPGAVVTLYANWSHTAATTFADPAGGHVAGAGARVYSSLQAAIDAAPDGGAVIAFPGTYGPIDARGRRGLYIYAAFAPDAARSESDLSVIDGGGRSPCAVFDVATGDGNVMLCGFHLTDGYGHDGGGAVGGILYNCLITDCEADEHGGGAYDSILDGCRVSSCRACASGGGAAFCDLYSSVIDGCAAEVYGGGAVLGTVCGSTIYGNSATAGAGVAGSTVQNSIVWENRLYETDKKGVRKLGNYANVGSGKTAIKSSFLYSDSSPKPSGKGNLAKDPLFVDAATGDFRLQTASPVKNKGSSTCLNGWNQDIRRLPRTLGAAPDMGANETPEGTMVPADYDGDGIADVACFDSATANWIMMRSRDGLVSVGFGEPRDLPLAVFFDGDHRADMAVYSSTAKAPAFSVLTRSWYSFGPYCLGEKGAQPVAADFDGDGYDDLAVFQGNAKKPAFKTLFSTVGDDPDDAMEVAFGTKGAKPVAGDFDGDGRVDFGCYTATASKPVFNVALSGRGWNAASPLAVALGAKGSEPCCGDFDGDGTTDFAVYSGTAKTPLLYRMFSTAKWREVRTLPFGQKGSRATTADWDGDGAADAAIEFQGAWWRVTRDWDVREIPAF